MESSISINVNIKNSLKLFISLLFTISMKLYFLITFISKFTKTLIYLKLYNIIFKHDLNHIDFASYIYFNLWNNGDDPCPKYHP